MQNRDSFSESRRTLGALRIAKIMHAPEEVPVRRDARVHCFRPGSSAWLWH